MGIQAGPTETGDREPRADVERGQQGPALEALSFIDTASVDVEKAKIALGGYPASIDKADAARARLTAAMGALQRAADELRALLDKGDDEAP